MPDDIMSCQALWVEVVITAIRDAQAEYSRARDKRGKAAVLASVRRWANGWNGMLVLSLAGITPGDRVTAALLRAVTVRQTFALGIDCGGDLPGRTRGRRRSVEAVV